MIGGLLNTFPRLCAENSLVYREKHECHFEEAVFFFFSSCRHPPVTFELRGGNCTASSCLFFIEAPISPHTLSSLEAPHAIVSLYIILLFFFQVLGSSPYWQSELAVSACRRLSVFCPKSGRGQYRDVETGGEAREKMEKKNPVWWGDD